VRLGSDLAAVEACGINRIGEGDAHDHFARSDHEPE
jgi:hypothetical protein